MSETIRQEIAKAVREYLGREPIDKAEEVEVRRHLYREVDGLLDAVLLEERRERKAARKGK